jgi:hypothetical protein
MYLQETGCLSYTLCGNGDGSTWAFVVIVI